MYIIRLSVMGLTQVESRLQTYRMLVNVCLVLCIVASVAAIYLFFRLQVYHILLEMTGIQKKREIQLLERQKGLSNKGAPVNKDMARHFSRAEQNSVIEETMVLQDEQSGEETVVLEPQMLFTVEKEVKLTESKESL